MANPQPDKYTKLSHEFLDALVRTRIRGEGRQLLDAIMRMTWGWNKKKSIITPADFVKKTGMDRGNVGRALRYLEERNMIIIELSDSGTNYSIQKDYDKWQ